MCNQMTLWGTRQCHFFAGIGGWALALRWAGYEQADGISDRHPVLVSRFRSREKDRALPTDDICGPLFTASSPSHDLQDALASRLAASWDLNGSLELDLTWREQAMPAGPPICRLVASARRTSAGGFGGWPIATSLNWRGRSRRAKRGRKLSTVATWPTPRAEKHTPQQRDDFTPNLPMVASWLTPVAGEGVGTANVGKKTTGLDRVLSNAETVKSGALNPAFVRWLMGYPPAWDYCGVTATR